MNVEVRSVGTRAGKADPVYANAQALSFEFHCRDISGCCESNNLHPHRDRKYVKTFPFECDALTRTGMTKRVCLGYTLMQRYSH